MHNEVPLYRYDTKYNAKDGEFAVEATDLSGGTLSPPS
jgi:hypothetical protein